MKAALLMIDVQNEYFAPGGQLVVPEGERALVQIQRLLDAARSARLPVCHIVHEALDPRGPLFRPGTPAVEIHPAIEVLPGEMRVKKHFPGSFTQTALEAYLRAAGIETVIIAGFQTQLCCDTTARQARERGFQVIFASDATAARDQALQGRVIRRAEIHERTLAVMASSFGARVASAAEIAALLR